MSCYPEKDEMKNLDRVCPCTSLLNRKLTHLDWTDLHRSKSGEKS